MKEKLTVKKEDLNKKKVLFKKCGVLTCLHNTAETCSSPNCEIFERTLIQEY